MNDSIYGIYNNSRQSDDNQSDNYGRDGFFASFRTFLPTNNILDASPNEENYAKSSGPF